jgi:hypothetical protein
MTTVISAPRGACRIAMKFWTSFIHSQSTFNQEHSIQGSNGRLSVSSLGHLDEGKTASLTCVTIFDYGDGLNWSVGCEQITQLLFCGVEIQVPNKNVSHNSIPSGLFAECLGQKSRPDTPEKPKRRSLNGNRLLT